jgi:hypothetical protein
LTDKGFHILSLNIHFFRHGNQFFRICRIQAGYGIGFRGASGNFQNALSLFIGRGRYSTDRIIMNISSLAILFFITPPFEICNSVRDRFRLSKAV